MSEHSYFVFDPEVPEDSFSQPFGCYIHEWVGGEPPSPVVKAWADHSFATKGDDLHETAHGEGVLAFPKPHSSSFVLRAACQPIYAPCDTEEEGETIAYMVALPERLSKRQRGWIELIMPPSLGGQLLLTTGEYELLKHLKVVSSVHPARPIKFKRLDKNPLAEKIKKENSLRELQLACLKPKVSENLLRNYAWWLGSLARSSRGDNQLYSAYSLMHTNLLLRAERLNQLKALIYSYYYSHESNFMGNTHKITSDWIKRAAVDDEDSLFFKAYGTDGWFTVLYKEQELPIALTALATAGYWSADCMLDDPFGLLTETINVFEYAHQSQDKLADKIYCIIHHPENPFDMLKSLISFNELMPALVAACRHDVDGAQYLASVFDDTSDTNIIYETLKEGDEGIKKMQQLIQILLKGG